MIISTRKYINNCRWKISLVHACRIAMETGRGHKVDICNQNLRFVCTVARHVVVVK